MHGGGQTRHSWSVTARRLADRGWETLALDLRGHGDSDWDPAGDYSLGAFSDDLVALLKAEDQPAVLVGASLGGMVALTTAAAEPERVRGVVLVDVVVKVEMAGVRRIRDFMTSAPDGFASLEEAADAVARYNPNRERPPSPAGLAKNLRRRENGRWYWHWDPTFMQANDDEPQRKVDLGALRAAAAAVTAPALIVRGARSDVVSERGMRDMLELMPGAATVDVPAAGHMVAGDDNDVFTVALEGFLSQLAPLRTGTFPAARTAR